MDRRSRILLPFVAAAWLLMQPIAAGAVTIQVNDLSDPGTVGDGVLTLREALRVAAGPVPGLSPAELGQISGGTAGAGSADVIRFAVAGTVALAGDGSAEALPPLSGGGDTLDGEGEVVLSGLGLPQGTLWGLRMTASASTVTGLAFEDVPGTVLHVQPPAGGTIAGTTISDNRISRPGVDAIRILAAALPTAGATVVGGLVDGTTVSGNTIEVATPGNLVNGYAPGALNLMAAYAAADGSLTGARVTNTLIQGNTIRDVFQGVFARAAVGAGALTDNAIEGLTVRDNVFERINDQTLYVGAATVQAGGTSSGNAVRQLVITNNTFRERILDPAATYLGGGPFVSGGFLDGCAVQDGTSTATGDVTELVEISNNTISDRAPYGIYVQGAQSCGGGGGTLTQSAVRHVVISGNTIEDSGTGISLTGGSSFLTQGPVTNEDNAIEDVTIATNTVTGNDIVGLELIGGVSNDGAASQNRIATVDVAENVFSGNRTAIAVTGGATIGDGDVARGNVISDLTIRTNQIVDSVMTAVLVQGSTLAPGADTADNEVRGLEIADNTFDRNGGAGIQLLGASAAAGLVTTGNLIDRPSILRNVIRDTVAAPAGGTDGIGVRLMNVSGGVIAAGLLEANIVERVAAVGIALVDTTGHTVARNKVKGFGRKSFVGSKKANKLIKNRFPRRRAKK
jgi:hypothetical protein